VGLGSFAEDSIIWSPIESVDAKRAGTKAFPVMGKPALVAMALVTRFAVVLVGSPAEGGAEPHRRNFGRGVGRISPAPGNTIGWPETSESTAPRGRNAGDLPVELERIDRVVRAAAPPLSAMECPTRATRKWLDQRGSFMATVAGRSGLPPAGRQGPGRFGDAAGEYGGFSMAGSHGVSMTAPTPTRPLEVLHPMGRTSWPTINPRALGNSQPNVPVFRTDPNSLVAHAQLPPEGETGRDRRSISKVTPSRAGWGATGLSRTAGQLEAELLRLERRPISDGART